MGRTHQEVSESPAGKACLEPGGSADLVQSAIALLSGRWKLQIVFELFGTERMRFSALERALASVSQKVLTQQLRALERDGVVERIVHAEVPPRVEYALTARGRALRPALLALREWIR